MKHLSKKRPLNKEGQEGFTLVELAIVMIVIGLLITGVLKGQELINNAQVTATVRQIEGIKGAVAIFRDSYGDIPGDMPNANQRLANCDNSCIAPGKGAELGNGRVEEDPATAPTVGSEAAAFFLQLAAADLITGVNSLATGAPVFGEHLPETPMGDSGLFVGYVDDDFKEENAGLLDPSRTLSVAHYFSISAAPDSDIGGEGADNFALTPVQAEMIDRKMDDGMPSNGDVRAAGPLTETTEDSTTPGCGLGSVTGIYTTSITTKSCALFISAF